LIIKGNQSLAVGYAVHVIDVYQRHLMRAKQEDQIRTALLAGKKPAQAILNRGFLQTADKWQDRLFKERPSARCLIIFYRPASASARRQIRAAPAFRQRPCWLGL
jgi:hypothetical protein